MINAHHDRKFFRRFPNHATPGWNNLGGGPPVLHQQTAGIFPSWRFPRDGPTELNDFTGIIPSLIALLSRIPSYKGANSRHALATYILGWQFRVAVLWSYHKGLWFHISWLEKCVPDVAAAQKPTENPADPSWEKQLWNAAIGIWFEYQPKHCTMFSANHGKSGKYISCV